MTIIFARLFLSLKLRRQKIVIFKRIFFILLSGKEQVQSVRTIHSHNQVQSHLPILLCRVVQKFGMMVAFEIEVSCSKLDLEMFRQNALSDKCFEKHKIRIKRARKESQLVRDVKSKAETQDLEVIRSYVVQMSYH